MATQLYSNQDLQAAAKNVRRAMLASLPEPDEIQYEFSPRLTQQVNNLIIKYERREKRMSVLRRVAVVFVALIIGAGTWLAVDVQARDAVFIWIKTIYNDIVVHQFKDNSNAIPDANYTLGWVPEGFILKDSHHSASGSSEWYADAVTGENIFFECISGDSAIEYSDFSNTEQVLVSGMTGYFYFANGPGETNGILLVNDDNGVIFMIDSELSKETILKIAENIQKCKDF